MQKQINILKSLKQHAQGTPEWHRYRDRLTITGTGVAKVLDESSYGNCTSYFLEQSGQKTPKIIPEYFSKHGKFWEPVALKLYELKTGERCFDVGCVNLYDVHDALRQWKDEEDLPKWYKKVGGSPDGITDSGILVEIKCPKTRKPIQCIEQIPKDYYHQIQFYLFMLDLEICHYVEFVPRTWYKNQVAKNGSFNLFVIRRDKKWGKHSLPLLEKFIKMVDDARA